MQEGISAPTDEGAQETGVKLNWKKNFEVSGVAQRYSGSLEVNGSKAGTYTERKKRNPVWVSF